MSMRRVLPRSSHTVACDRFSRKRRSWLMRTRADALLGQARLEPFDGRQVEVVGRLVEQQDVGRRRQHVGQRGAAQLAARQRRGVLLAAEPQLLQQIARLMRIVGGAEAGLHVGQRGRVAGEVRLLRQVAHRGARLHEALAPVGLDQPRRDLQQRRLARAVAPDQADPLAAATASSAPSSSGVPPKVSAMSLSWRGRGGHWRCIAPRCDGCSGAWRSTGWPGPPRRCQLPVSAHVTAMSMASDDPVLPENRDEAACRIALRQDGSES